MKMRSLQATHAVASVAAVCLCWTASASAAPSLMIFPGAYPTSASFDGKVLAGNTASDFETFRWTEATGVVPLGRATVPVIGVGAGAPTISWDGTRISATIMDDANQFATAGRWTLNQGWQQSMPPSPPTGGVADNAYGSAYGLSGDGHTVVGLYWRPGQPDGRAHAFAWTEATGAVGLGSSGLSSRANKASFDGSVVVGWDWSNLTRRRPTVWTNGVLEVIEPNLEVDCELFSVTGDGRTVAGTYFSLDLGIREAAIWRNNGSSWVLQRLGVLPGTDPLSGFVGNAFIDNAGRQVVGQNRYRIGGPGSGVQFEGYYWSQETGMISATTLLQNLGVATSPDFYVVEFSGISPDGSTLLGVAIENNQLVGFSLQIPEPTGLALLGIPVLMLGRRARRP